MGSSEEGERMTEEENGERIDEEVVGVRGDTQEGESEQRLLEAEQLLLKHGSLLRELDLLVLDLDLHAQAAVRELRAGERQGGGDRSTGALRRIRVVIRVTTMG
jgi:hypothetical protein